jgi:hypothetical protein
LLDYVRMNLSDEIQKQKLKNKTFYAFKFCLFVTVCVKTKKAKKNCASKKCLTFFVKSPYMFIWENRTQKCEAVCESF